MPDELIFAETSLAVQTHKLALVAGDAFLVVAINLYTETKQHDDNSVWKISCNCIAKTTDSRASPNLKPSNARYESSCVSDLRARRHLCTLTSLCFAFEKHGASDKPASFDDSFTPLRDVEYYCALDCAMISKQLE